MKPWVPAWKRVIRCHSGGHRYHRMPHSSIMVGGVRSAQVVSRVEPTEARPKGRVIDKTRTSHAEHRCVAALLIAFTRQ